MQVAARSFAGGSKPKPIDPKTTDYDVVFVGGINAVALAKFVQQHEYVAKRQLKMAVISPHNKFVQPQLYFAVTHGHVEKLKIDSGSVNSQIDNWSKTEIGVHATKVDPQNNTIELSNKKVFNYKALVLAPGMNHGMDKIEGLQEMSEEPDSENTFVHMLDSVERTSRNWYTGWNNFMGDMICYSPAFPYKGEGSDFYALYFEHFLRTDKIQGRATPGSRVQYWSPNKKIYQFDYANEQARIECDKRGIEVNLGWEMIKVGRNSSNEKVATFKNVDDGRVIEHEFFSANINPTSTPVPIIAESGLGDAGGMMDVNKYTLQHKKYENVFSFGDAVGFDTTRTHTAAIAQNSVIKNNLIRFLQDKTPNGVYDGFSSQNMWLGHSHATQFAHNHDFEPHMDNHIIPHHGIFSKFWFEQRMLKNSVNSDKNYSSFTKDQGPPHRHYCQEFDELEHNEYLTSKGVAWESLVHPARSEAAE